MAADSNSTVYVGNLDERVSERVLYDILIQAGRVVDLHIPREKETGKPKGYAFAAYESEEVADYAVKLFSGIVTLYKRTLKFGISGQDKSSATPSTDGPSLRPRQRRKNSDHQSSATPSTDGPSLRPRQRCKNSDHHSHVSRLSATNYPDVLPDMTAHQSHGYRSYRESTDYSYNRRVSDSELDSVSRSSSRRYDKHDSTNRNPYH